VDINNIPIRKSVRNAGFHGFDIIINYRASHLIHHTRQKEHQVMIDLEREYNKAVFKQCPECGKLFRDHEWDELVLHYAHSLKSMVKWDHYKSPIPRWSHEHV